jgi:hypothetical protein
MLALEGEVKIVPGQGDVVEYVAFLSLSSCGFSQIIGLSQIIPWWMRKKQLQTILCWPGPMWSSPGISISLQHLDRHFIDTIALLFTIRRPHRGIMLVANHTTHWPFRSQLEKESWPVTYVRREQGAKALT